MENYTYFLKAAFDKVKRQRLWQIMRKYGIREKLIEVIENMYEETTCKIKLKDKCTERFWTRKGLRQGCPLSPLLFLIFIADIEEFLKKRGNGGVYTLAYADDLAIIATTEKELKRMIKTTEKYLEEKEMILNAEKSKVMVFSRRDRNKEERKWKWKEECIEEVEEFNWDTLS